MTDPVTPHALTDELLERVYQEAHKGRTGVYPAMRAVLAPALAPSRYQEAFDRIHMWVEQQVASLKAHRCDDPTCEVPTQLQVMRDVLATFQDEWAKVSAPAKKGPRT